ncbi:MAG: PepSY-associated TM helix domain-containing protein, partial [Hyphomicrobiaceae bacterium]
LVELAACWAIVMLLTGLYLWWPRERRLAGVLWPRLGSGGRAFWRDLHAVTGFWVSMFALILLVTGLPWAAVWGSAFRAVRTEMGWMNGPQSWSIGGRVSTSEQHGSPAGNAPHIGTSLAKALPVMVEKAAHETLDFPVLVIPPGAPQRFASPVAAWTIKSETQIRPRQTTILFDPVSLEQVSRENFSDRHPIDRAVGYGVAWHEGQLFGWPNQLIGLITATCLIVLAMTGFVMWRLRKPVGALGAPAPLQTPVRARHLAVMLVILAALLPLLAMSLVAIGLFEQLIVRRNARIANWLGA